ncbi:tripartite tricarboxylate transporter substrate binding protein [Corticibacter populi]|uniref:Tripartite tricarboxylate transporter substrate binding protein n=1 Tax=Corticibacter populi TaxID=1550736 RepID=A0A3M6R0Y7_9BURK|nr:tripartite tricarboxylate transporter substrate binding protein [Corticibacter populi]RMX08843.1 tripartite tricarboxylate transporter substrate binding protein [Corticibacter populi]RZS35243.1 putative tricarboxylic transport membrane protein [Corticibacter populi]
MSNQRSFPTTIGRLLGKASAAACLGLSLLALTGTAVQAEPRRPECIAPAQPGGGFDLTCRLTQAALKESGALKSPLRIVYMPGGVGAVAYNNIVAQRPAEGGAIVAFSGGSLLNLAQGKFGRYTVDDVRWLAAIGADYGVAVVREDSPFQNLSDLMAALKEDPSKVVFGAGGTVGSQDWMKAALTARAAGIDYKRMRFVAFEGGGEGITALRGNHIQAYMGDAAEASTILEGGAPIKILAVFHNERLPGRLAEVPTAKEQGFDIEWPIIRGFYLGPKVSDADYDWWTDAFKTATSHEAFAKLREQQGLFPFDLSGPALDAYVKDQVKEYAELAKSFGLIQ